MQISKPTPEGQAKRFQDWLESQDKTRSWVAEILGVSLGRASHIICHGLCPKWHLVKLRDAGVPEEVLPMQSRGKSGPKPGELARLRKLVAQAELEAS